MVWINKKTASGIRVVDFLGLLVESRRNASPSTIRFPIFTLSPTHNWYCFRHRRTCIINYNYLEYCRKLVRAEPDIMDVVARYDPASENQYKWVTWSRKFLCVNVSRISYPWVKVLHVLIYAAHRTKDQLSKIPRLSVLFRRLHRLEEDTTGNVLPSPHFSSFHSCSRLVNPLWPIIPGWRLHKREPSTECLGTPASIISTQLSTYRMPLWLL